MPLYSFLCKCGFEDGVIKPISKPPKSRKCRQCGKSMVRDYRVNVGIFRPYTERAFTGQPILVESSEHRDRLCKEHKVTPDSFKYSKPKPMKTAIESLEYSEVKDRLNNVSDQELESERSTSDVERRRDLGGGVSTQEIPITGTAV